MKTILPGLMIIGALLGAVGCAKTTTTTTQTPAAVAKVDDLARMQGAWTGREPGATPEGPSHFTVAADAFEFHGTDANEWYKGTFALKENTNPKRILIMVKECPEADFVGKTSHGIYRFVGNKLIISASAPGSEDWPSDFGAEGSRTIEFMK